MNNRIAILSDIHGDTTALKAVIADARALGATEYWLLGDILLPGPGREDLFELLDAIPITAAVRGNWDDCVLEALDGEYGLEDPQEIQLLRLTQYLMEGLDPKRIDWLRSLPLVEKKEVNGIRFSLTHNLPEKNYGGFLRPANVTENFDQLLDDQTDMAIYGHVHKQLLRYGSQGQQILNPGTIGMPYFDWGPIQNHRAQYALIDVEEDGVTNLQFRKVAYDYEAELQDAKDKGLPFIEMYEELRREDNYRGHNIDLLTGLIEKYGYAKEVAAYFNLSNES
ncbi:metallophosphoesterase [Streptococcus parasanguinis]|uniref:Metallophosphoesterase n=1 Tax=Streptococcus parasanguinis TaxID=1318 RepID=A0A6I3PHJ9_STRPA|nr:MULTISPECIES: metallophosphoesterase family protein [Streptococcus]MTR53835.1 metallophosphoesterase [Streptococcus parasanguinis]MTR55652.1 metallophosphoesterase [Streptococcus parasanguinis]MTR60476.1 metallophosphoesterase [Streptococcus parasanguinis]MTR61960.1 metallophosphoesterase [Streptococcus parasanguinis]MTR64360.1 metallophosphoesterase [Streptococcus parasanguinis]